MNTLILSARLKPEAKNPPNGAMRLAKRLKTMAWIWKEENDTSPSGVVCVRTWKTDGISQRTCSKGLITSSYCGHVSELECWKTFASSLSHSLMTYQKCDHKGTGTTPDEPFPCLLGREFNQLRLAETDPKDVGEDIVGDHQEARQDEPNETCSQK